MEMTMLSRHQHSRQVARRGRPLVRVQRLQAESHDAAGSQLSRQLTFDDSQGATRGSRAGGLRATTSMDPQQLRQHSVADPTNNSHPGYRPSSLVRHRSKAADASKQPATPLMDTLQWKNRGDGAVGPKERSHAWYGPVLHIELSLPTPRPSKKTQRICTNCTSHRI